MAFLAFLLVLGVCLLVVSGLVFFAAWVHKDTDGEHKTGDERVSINDLLE